MKLIENCDYWKWSLQTGRQWYLSLQMWGGTDLENLFFQEGSFEGASVFIWVNVDAILKWNAIEDLFSTSKFGKKFKIIFVL